MRLGKWCQLFNVQAPRADEDKASLQVKVAALQQSVHQRESKLQSLQAEHLQAQVDCQCMQHSPRLVSAYSHSLSDWLCEVCTFRGGQDLHCLGMERVHIRFVSNHLARITLLPVQVTCQELKDGARSAEGGHGDARYARFDDACVELAEMGRAGKLPGAFYGRLCNIALLSDMQAAVAINAVVKEAVSLVRTIAHCRTYVM